MVHNELGSTCKSELKIYSRVNETEKISNIVEIYLRHRVIKEMCLSLDVNGYLATSHLASAMNKNTPIDVIWKYVYRTHEK